MSPDVTEQIVNVVGSLVALLIGWAALAIRKKYAVDTKTTLDDRAIDFAEGVLADLVLQLAPDIATALSDGRVTQEEADRLFERVRVILGTSGFDRLQAATGLDLTAFKAWLLSRIGVKVAAAKAEGLGPFFASPEMSRRMQETK